MEDQTKINKLIKRSAYILVIVLIITIIALLILKYEVEGEKNMPFRLSGIIIVSNAEGHQEKENKDYKWDTQIYQNNDVYLNIEKNKNYKDIEAIKQITIDNIKIIAPPKVGKIEIYRLNENNLQEFNYKDEFKIIDSITYIGDKNSDIKNLKISNQGSTLVFRFLNKTGKNYKSNDEEFEHNGKLLNKVGVSYEDIKTTVSFDITIVLQSEVSFKGNIELELPIGDITKEGASSTEINDMRKVVFKREENKKKINIGD